MSVYYVFFCGTFFALLQFSYFFILQSELSSTGITYFATTSSWILGAILGLSVKKKISFFGESALMAGSVLSFYLLVLMVGKNPFNTAYLWFYAALVTVSGIYAGYFFNSNIARFERIKNLFFWENNGFILGIIASFLIVTLISKTFLLFLLIISCALLILAHWALRKKEEEQNREFDPILSKYIIKR